MVGPVLAEPPDHPDIVVTGYGVRGRQVGHPAGTPRPMASPSAYESFSLVVLEAWAVGVPVLVNATCSAGGARLDRRWRTAGSVPSARSWLTVDCLVVRWRVSWEPLLGAGGLYTDRAGWGNPHHRALRRVPRVGGGPGAQGVGRRTSPAGSRRAPPMSGEPEMGTGRTGRGPGIAGATRSRGAHPRVSASALWAFRSLGPSTTCSGGSTTPCGGSRSPVPSRTVGRGRGGRPSVATGTGAEVGGSGSPAVRPTPWHGYWPRPPGDRRSGRMGQPGGRGRPPVSRRPVFEVLEGAAGASSVVRDLGSLAPTPDLSEVTTDAALGSGPGRCSTGTAVRRRRWCRTPSGIRRVRGATGHRGEGRRGAGARGSRDIRPAPTIEALGGIDDRSLSGVVLAAASTGP